MSMTKGLRRAKCVRTHMAKGESKTSARKSMWSEN